MLLQLSSTIELFDSIGPEERLELLMDYGNQLAPLSTEYVSLRDSGAYIVQECQAPVFFMVEVKADRLSIQVDAPEEAAIARGFAALLKELFDGVPLPLDQDLPENILHALHLESLLGMQRQRGLSAIYKKLTDQLSG